MDLAILLAQQGHIHDSHAEHDEKAGPALGGVENWDTAGIGQDTKAGHEMESGYCTFRRWVKGPGHAESRMASVEILRFSHL